MATISDRSPLPSAHDSSTTSCASPKRRSTCPRKARATLMPIGVYRGLRSSAATIAAPSVPPVPRSDTAAICDEPANVVADMTIAATLPKCSVRARTPNEMPTAVAAGKTGAPARSALRMPAAEAARLLAVAADRHVAPLPRAIPCAVDERPLAVVGTTGLQPRPRSIGHRLGDGGEHGDTAAEDEPPLLEAPAEPAT